MAVVVRGSDGGAVKAGTEDERARGMRALVRGWSRARVVIGGFAGETGAPVVIGAVSHGAAGGAAPSW